MILVQKLLIIISLRPMAFLILFLQSLIKYFIFHIYIIIWCNVFSLLSWNSLWMMITPSSTGSTTTFT